MKTLLLLFLMVLGVAALAVFHNDLRVMLFLFLANALGWVQGYSEWHHDE